MNWDDTEARKEFAWLRLMARLKYDGYRDFQAGARFIESLATWLQQFEKGSDRKNAYDFIRHHLVYVGPSEMQHLVHQFYPRIIRPGLAKVVAQRLGTPLHTTIVNQEAQSMLRRLRRQTLFMALSDGARIDELRRSNVGLLSNEQLVVATQVDTEKWQDLLAKLRKDLDDTNAKFACVYLVDDFMGTGTTLLREKSGAWDGKLVRFLTSVKHATDGLNGETLFEDDWQLRVHHYLATDHAHRKIGERATLAYPQLNQLGLRQPPIFTFGNVFPPSLPVTSNEAQFEKFIAIAKKYYDPEIETVHTRVGGTTGISLGYGDCALPLALDHNTPNNSIALLWAESSGSQISDSDKRHHAMRPLFRRRQRHTGGIT